MHRTFVLEPMATMHDDCDIGLAATAPLPPEPPRLPYSRSKDYFRRDLVKVIELQNQVDKIDSTVAALDTVVTGISNRMSTLEESARSMASEGVRVRVQNEGGELYVTLGEDTQPLLTPYSFYQPHGTLLGLEGEIRDMGVDIDIKNKDGILRFEPGSYPSSSSPASSPSSASFFGLSTGTWAKVLLGAGAVYYWRTELRIIGRGIMAGANLAIERMEKKHKEKKETPRQQDQSPTQGATRPAPANVKTTSNTIIEQARLKEVGKKVDDKSRELKVLQAQMHESLRKQLPLPNNSPSLLPHSQDQVQAYKTASALSQTANLHATEHKVSQANQTAQSGVELAKQEFNIVKPYANLTARVNPSTAKETEDGAVGKSSGLLEDFDIAEFFRTPVPRNPYAGPISKSETKDGTLWAQHYPTPLNSSTTSVTVPSNPFVASDNLTAYIGHAQPIVNPDDWFNFEKPIVNLPTPAERKRKHEGGHNARIEMTDTAAATLMQTKKEDQASPKAKEDTRLAQLRAAHLVAMRKNQKDMERNSSSKADSGKVSQSGDNSGPKATSSSANECTPSNSSTSSSMEAMDLTPDSSSSDEEESDYDYDYDSEAESEEDESSPGLLFIRHS
jgi:hypothetical protein